MHKLREEDTIKVMLQADATAQIGTVTTVADVAGSLNGKYFTWTTPRGKYVVWFLVTGFTESQPVVDLYSTYLKVEVAANATANTVAAAIQAVVNPLARVDATVLTNVVTITNNEGGLGAAAAATSGFTVAITTPGVNGTFTTLDCKSLSRNSANGNIISVGGGVGFAGQTFGIQSGAYIVVDSNYVGVPEYIKN